MIYTIEPSKSALIIIDPQKEYFNESRPLFTPHAAEILDNLVKIKDAARKAGITTILIQHVHRIDGSDLGRMGDFDPTPVFVEGTPAVDLIPEMEPGQGEVLIKKTRYSAFVGTRLDSTLRSQKIDTVIVVGLMTNFCCVTTARHAHDLDYKVVFVSDANAGPDMPDMGFGPIPHSEILKNVATSLAGGIGDVVDTAELLQAIDGQT